MPSPCYANEGASHWLGLQRSSEGACRDSPGGVVVTQTHGPSRLLGCAGCPPVQGTCYLFGERSSIRPHTLPHSPLFPGTARFFFRGSNFCIPVSPESWGPEAVLSLGAVPWQRRFLWEPDFCSWAGFASSPSHPQERGASPLPASASGSKQTPSPFCCPSPGHCMLSVLSLSSAIFSFRLPPLLHLFRVSHSLRKDG